jgi:hypothetical protein
LAIKANQLNPDKLKVSPNMMLDIGNIGEISFGKTTSPTGEKFLTATVALKEPRAMPTGEHTEPRQASALVLFGGPANVLWLWANSFGVSEVGYYQAVYDKKDREDYVEAVAAV